MPLDGPCPDCGVALRPNAQKCDCGWAPKPIGKSYAETADLNRFRCEWNANGERCRNPGTSSSSTMGSGPFYCSPHFRCSSGALGQLIVEESRKIFFPDYTAKTMYESSLAAYLARPAAGIPVTPSAKKVHPSDIGKPHGDPKAWARRIVAATAAGTYTLPLGIQMAREALHLPAMREPGEEG